VITLHLMHPFITWQVGTCMASKWMKEMIDERKMT